jgi:hypothetical protein
LLCSGTSESESDSATGRAQVNKSRRLADAQRVQGGAAFSSKAAAAGAVPHPDVLMRGDFVSEELSTERGRDAFSKLVNVEHIKTVLFELEAGARAAPACTRARAPACLPPGARSSLKPTKSGSTHPPSFSACRVGVGEWLEVEPFLQQSNDTNYARDHSQATLFLITSDNF